MAINGIATVVWTTRDLPAASRFFTDFGLPLQPTPADVRESRFRLEEGSEVVLRDVADERMPASCLSGPGIREVVWGVDSEASLAQLVGRIAKDREVRRDADGTVHFLSEAGLAYGLRVYPRKTVVYAPDAVNAAGHIRRLNQHRKWRRAARPKTINHVVLLVKSEDIDREVAFMVACLDFRITDIQEGVGVYLRADGTHEHHSILVGDASLLPGPAQPCFNHAAFGVEDIDELMTGANVMTRARHQRGFLGVGRHRIGSALHSYWQVPGGGGEAEFSANTDYLDDQWQPRRWNRYFGQWIWSASLNDFPEETPPWGVAYMGDISTYDVKK